MAEGPEWPCLFGCIQWCIAPRCDFQFAIMTDSPQIPKKSTLHRLERYRPQMADILNAANFNKGTAFTLQERVRAALHCNASRGYLVCQCYQPQETHRLRGLLPPRVETLDEQLARSVSQLRYGTAPRCGNARVRG